MIPETRDNDTARRRAEEEYETALINSSTKVVALLGMVRQKEAGGRVRTPHVVASILLPVIPEYGGREKRLLIITPTASLLRLADEQRRRGRRAVTFSPSLPSLKGCLTSTLGKFGPTLSPLRVSA